MVAIITGDIVRSRQAGSPARWDHSLREALSVWGDSPTDWDIYRGDSFQLRLSQPAQALQVALWLKAAIRQIKPLDVRMGIGIGEEAYRAERVSASHGPAYERSGTAFDRLKKDKRLLLLYARHPDMDTDADILLRLVSALADEWSAASAAIMALALSSRDQPQSYFSQRLGISQSSVSERLSRAHAAEILAAEAHFRRLFHRYFSPDP